MRCAIEHITVAVLVFCILTHFGFAQTLNPSFRITSPTNFASTQFPFTDTTKTSDTLQSVVLRRSSDSKPSNKGYESTKSAGLAVLLSAVLPGAGQIYNESYWKAPVIWALGGYWVYEWMDLNNKYKAFRDSIAANPPYGYSRFQRVRDFYRDERDKFAWYLGALYFANLLDAYVGASLYDFNVSPDLSAEGVVVPRFTVSIRLPF